MVSMTYIHSNWHLMPFNFPVKTSRLGGYHVVSCIEYSQLFALTVIPIMPRIQIPADSVDDTIGDVRDYDMSK